MMRTRTLSEIALAISTDCCAASVSPRAGLRTSSATPSEARIASASRYICRQSGDGAAVLVADEDVLGDVEVGEEQRLLVDRRDARGAAPRRRCGWRWAGRRAGSSPRSGWWTPVMILMSVDLPAPFSPSSAWTSPARRVSDTSSSACVAPKRLAMPRIWSTGAPAAPPSTVASVTPPRARAACGALSVSLPQRRTGGLAAALPSPAGRRASIPRPLRGRAAARPTSRLSSRGSTAGPRVAGLGRCRAATLDPAVEPRGDKGEAGTSVSLPQSMCHWSGSRKGKPRWLSISIRMIGAIHSDQRALTGSSLSAAMVASRSSVSK